MALSGELYLGVAVDYTACRPVLVLASRAGGVEIEQIAARENPDQILRIKTEYSPSARGSGSERRPGIVAAFLAGDGPAARIGRGDSPRAARRRSTTCSWSGTWRCWR